MHPRTVTWAAETARARVVLLATLLPPLLLMLPAGCDHCYTSGVNEEQTCQTSGAFAIDVAPVFHVACPPKLAWTGNSGTSTLTLQKGCATDDDYWIYVSFPRGVSDASYALPSPAIDIMASFSPSPPSPRDDPNPRPSFDTSRGSLAVDAGSALVHRSVNESTAPGHENYDIDADLDIRFRAATGDEFSVSGHILADHCVLHDVPWCYGD